MFDKSDSVLSCRQKTIVSLEVKDFSAVPSSAAKKKKVVCQEEVQLINNRR